MTAFVLVHGSWHRSWCWQRLAPYLSSAGHTVTAVDLPADDPRASAADYARTITAAAAAAGRPEETVVVAHSSAGLVATVAAEQHPVRELLLIAAFIPRPGIAWYEQMPAERVLQDDFAPVQAGLPQDAGGISLPPEIAASYFYNDCDPGDDAAATSQLLPDCAVGPFLEPSLLTGSSRTPSRYVLCTGDRTIRAAWAREAAGAYCDEIIEMDSGHSPFWSRPNELASVLLRTA
jgi:pimeloyl-ACP methyl ester carboxylesterase